MPQRLLKGIFASHIDEDHLCTLDVSTESCHEVPSSSVPSTPSVPSPVPPPSSGATNWTRHCHCQGASEMICPSNASPSIPLSFFIFPNELSISTMLLIKRSVINQMQNLAALKEQPVSSAPTVTSLLPSQPPCFITHHNGGACIHWLFISAAWGLFKWSHLTGRAGTHPIRLAGREELASR